MNTHGPRERVETLSLPPPLRRNERLESHGGREIVGRSEVRASLRFPLDVSSAVNRRFHDDGAFPLAPAASRRSLLRDTSGTTEDDGRYSLTSRSHLSQEAGARGEGRASRGLAVASSRWEIKPPMRRRRRWRRRRGFCGGIAGSVVTTSERRSGFRRSA